MITCEELEGELNFPPMVTKEKVILKMFETWLDSVYMMVNYILKVKIEAENKKLLNGLALKYKYRIFYRN